jgi:glycosyltransferase involved in cell wall biosynthesis
MARAEQRGRRVVYLNPVGVLGGAERSLLDVMASFRQADPAAELHLIAATDGPLLERARSLGVGVTLLPMPDCVAELGDSTLKGLGRARAFFALAGRAVRASWPAWRYAERLRQTVAALRPGVVHSNGIKCHLLTRLARLTSCPVLWHVHDFLSSRPVTAPALRWASARIRGAIAVSQAVGGDVRDVLPRVPVDVIYNAVDTGHFMPAPADGVRLDRLANLPPAAPGTVRVGLIAAFGRWKGQVVFLEAAARVVRSRPANRRRFYVVGGPNSRTSGSQFSEGELRAKATEFGVADRVGFTGFQANVADLYRALDVVVHASTAPEPFGMAVVEAMACGKPVIVSRAGGAAELFTHDHDAVGVPPGDAAALASAVNDLAADASRRVRLAERARQTAVAKFSRERLGFQVGAVYDRITGAHCHAHRGEKGRAPCP